MRASLMWSGASLARNVSSLKYPANWEFRTAARLMSTVAIGVQSIAADAYIAMRQMDD